MMRLAPSYRAWLGAVALSWLLSAGCGGESSVSVGVPTENNGPVISGQVAMPNGQVAAAPTLYERVAAAVVARVEALVASNVRPVGAGVRVRVVRIAPGNIRNGAIVGGQTVNEATTDSAGRFALRLPTGTDPNTCRFVLEVGATRDRTLTRAFVDAASVDVTFESEAAVRLLLQEIKADRVALCDLDAGELFSVRSAVHDSEAQAFGDTAGALNNSATVAAGSDPDVQSAIALAIGAATPVPSATDTVAPTATVPLPTATAPRATPTHTAVATRTPTEAPTRTHTAVPTATTAATDTAVPTRTHTPQPTATTAPTNTATTAPTHTATTAPTNTPRPTDTATVAPATATAAATATVTSALPAVNIGVVAGTAGSTVDVPVTLVANGAQIAAVGTDIELDAEALSVVGTGSGPDCRVDDRLAGSKTVVAAVADLGGGRARLRVGLIGKTNNALITSGPLYACRFAIAAGASGSTDLLNVSEAAGPQAQAVAVASGAGRIDIGIPPPGLGLDAGTAVAMVGDTVEVTAALAARGAQVAAVASDIRFPATRLRAVTGAGGAPDCTLDPAIAALAKRLVAGQLPSAGGQDGIRVGVIGNANNTPLPGGAGAAVFRCRFEVLSGGGAVALEQQAEGASPAAETVELLGQGGSIAVQ